MPGRIIQAMKRAGSSNPVFLLDEVDKIGSDFRGDPAAALLEVLDPEQNVAFSDNYLELDFDLSNVLFLTTANTLHDIPPALQDRMEIIRLPGYLEHEKVGIARHFLIPKIRKELSVEDINVKIPDETILYLIRDYTREAGVRELERKLTAVYRNITLKEVTRRKHRAYTLKPKDVAKFIGVPQYQYTEVPAKAEYGYAVGLAWTESGGEVLPIEVSLVPGQHKLTLTGKLGEVMQESATAALTYVRAHAARFGIEQNTINDNEIHIHAPEGAIPKEGPSAGITMVAAIISALTENRIPTTMAMTGEISLSGDILPVGGLNEKLLAARRVGIHEIILPYKNTNEISELPKDLLEGMKLHKIKKIDDGLKVLFGKTLFKGADKKPPKKAPAKKKPAKPRGKKK